MMKANISLAKFPAWVLILKTISENPDKNISYITRLVNCTYSHSHKLFIQLEENGLIIKEQENRSKRSKLTDKGKIVVKSLNEIFEILDLKGELEEVKNRKYYIEKGISNNIQITDNEEEYNWEDGE